MTRLAALARSEHFRVLVGYTLVALLTSFPLVAQFQTHIPGVDGDVWSYLWALGWARASIFLGANPFHTDYVFYPLGGATQLLWATALPSFASVPLQLAFGLVPAFNVMYLAASVLTGYGMYLLAKYEIRNSKFEIQNSKFKIQNSKFEIQNSKFEIQNSKFEIRNSDVVKRKAESGKQNIALASFIAGLAFTFSALRLGYGLAFTNLFHTEFIPFYVLFLLKMTRTRGWKNAALAGLLFGLNAYVDFQSAAFLVLFTALWLAYQGVRVLCRAPRVLTYWRARDARNPVVRAGVLSIVAALVVLPMLGVVLDDFAVEGGNYIRVFPLKYSAERSYDALSYFVPNARSTLYQNLPAPRVENVNASAASPDESEMSPDRQNFLGVTLLALAALGVIRFGRKTLFWIGVALVFALLSLGPVLHFAGVATDAPLPFALVNQIPILNNIRIPMRYGMMVFFSASLLAGAGALTLLQWRTWTALPIIGLLLAESLVLPYPTLEFRVPRIYEQIARTPDDVTVLEIPSFQWRSAAQNAAYQAIHQKRILRAYTNRIAPDLAEYFNLRQTPLVVRSLRILEGAEEGVLTDAEIAQDRAALDDTLAFFRLRYAVVHRRQLPAERVAQIDAYLRAVMRARVLDDDGEVIAYEFPPTAFTAQARALDLASNATLMYLGRGWQIEPLADADGSQGRYAQAARAQIYAPPSDAAQLDVDVYSAQNDAPLQVQVNAAPAQKLNLRQGWHAYTLAAPLSQRLNLLQLWSDADARERFAIGALEWK